MRKIDKISEKYRQISVIIVNTIILFILLNVALYFLMPVFEDRVPRGPMIYGEEVLKKVYPNMSIEEINGLLRESWAYINLEYEPFTQFKRGPQSGKYVNIDESGFRHVENQCQFPIDKKKFNIFVFGGSTTFGSGVGDWETFPSRIQARLNEALKGEKVCVYNFGRGFYYSSQERILFQELINNGAVPDMAVFVDGLNDFYYAGSEPEFTKNLKDYFAGKGRFKLFLFSSPIGKVITFLSPTQQTIEDKNKEQLQSAIDRYFSNKRLIEAIGKEFGVSTYFVIQPVPTFNYNLSNHIVYMKNKEILTPEEDSKQGYVILDRDYRKMPDSAKKNLIWLADIQLGKNENLYVDSVHYNQEFSVEIASKIVLGIRSDVK